MRTERPWHKKDLLCKTRAVRIMPERSERIVSQELSWVVPVREQSRAAREAIRPAN
jgi:hypothetical protein